VKSTDDYSRVIAVLKSLERVSVKIYFKTRWPLKESFKILYLDPSSVIERTNSEYDKK
jgi:hypothetical protein